MRALRPGEVRVEEQVVGWISTFSYPAVLLLLLACGVGMPLSEDLILVTAGVLVSQGAGELAWMISIGWLGVVGGDLLLYRLGRSLGPRLKIHPRLGPVLAGERPRAIEAKLATHGWLSVLAARFVPGVRMPTFLLAGAGGVPIRHFIVADGIGAMITAPLLVILGHRFGQRVLSELELGSRWLVSIVLCAALVFAMLWGVRHAQRLSALRRWRG